jgi:crotonobetainyl-CoA:carnitine CoA-transferase CaiB-like acyl-CoA transferase
MVEVSLLDGVLHMISPSLLWVDNDPTLSGTTSQPVRGLINGVFEAAESTYLMLVALSDSEFRRLFDVIGLSEQGALPQFATRSLRLDHAAEVYGLLTGMLETRRAEEWVALLHEENVPCSLVRLDRRELIEEDQLWKNDMLVEVHHPTKGRMVQGAIGFRYSDSAIGTRNPAPSLGLDSRSVLSDLGYTEMEIGNLVNIGTVRVAEGEE